MKKYLFFFVLIFIPSITMAVSIDINTATAQQLEKIIGIGPAYAKAIIAARPFFSIDDLARVKGIGPKTLEKIKAQGWACVNCSSPAPKESLIKINETTSAQNILPKKIETDNNKTKEQPGDQAKLLKGQTSSLTGENSSKNEFAQLLFMASGAVLIAAGGILVGYYLTKKNVGP